MTELPGKFLQRPLAVVVLAFAAGLACGLVPWWRASQRVATLAEMLRDSESTVDMLGQKNLERSHRNTRARMEIKAMQKDGRPASEIVSKAFQFID